jgi:hypothetical protein
LSPANLLAEDDGAKHGGSRDRHKISHENNSKEEDVAARSAGPDRVPDCLSGTFLRCLRLQENNIVILSAVHGSALIHVNDRELISYSGIAQNGDLGVRHRLYHLQALEDREFDHVESECKCNGCEKYTQDDVKRQWSHQDSGYGKSRNDKKIGD